MTKSGRYLLLYLAIVAGSALLDANLGYEESIGAFTGGAIFIAGAYLLYFWNKNHSIENSVNASRRTFILTAALPLIGASIYFFRYYGLKKGVVKTSLGFGFVVVCAFVYYFSYTIL